MRTAFLPVVLLALIVGACGDEDPSYEDAEVKDRAREMEAGTPTYGVYNVIKAMGGAPVEVGGEVGQPYFAVKGRELIINGGSVELYEFDSRQDADAAAGQIGPTGQVSGQSPFTGPVYWYRSDLVIGLYRGNDPVVLNALTTALGAPFAQGAG